MQSVCSWRIPVGYSLLVKLWYWLCTDSRNQHVGFTLH